MLESISGAPDGGVCIDRQDTRELLHYIRDLERGYE
jgi:hypothetical protein